jgi:cytochrome b6-f complex iron-sulfur subunit
MATKFISGGWTKVVKACAAIFSKSGAAKSGNEKTAAAESAIINSRRDFVKYFLFGSAVTWALAAFYGLSRFFTPPKTKAVAPPKFVDLAKNADTIEINSSLVFPFGDRPAILIREKSGKFLAYFATCPHLGCIVQFNAKSAQILCPCHEGIFDLNGKNFSGPPTEPLEPLAVHVTRKNKIRITLPGAEAT